jgi:hypothetical protein
MALLSIGIQIPRHKTVVGYFEGLPVTGKIDISPNLGASISRASHITRKVISHKTVGFNFKGFADLTEVPHS